MKFTVTDGRVTRSIEYHVINDTPKIIAMDDEPTDVMPLPAHVERFARMCATRHQHCQNRTFIRVTNVNALIIDGYCRNQH